jgi:hypothetical protein
MSGRRGSAQYFGAVLQLADLHSRAGRHAAAYAALEQAPPDATSGYWRASLLLGRAAVHTAAGNPAAARADCQAVLDDTQAPPAQRKQAETFLADRLGAASAAASAMAPSQKP